MKRPNILFLFTDQQRFDTIQALHSSFQASTPHMDELVNGGVVFENCFCTAPISSPSRSTLVTGLMPSEAGMAGNLYAPSAPLSPAIRGIGHHMRAGGYQTVYHGKWHLGGDIQAHGFEIAEESSHDESTRLMASRFWRDRDWMEHDRPFFHMVSYLNPHDLYFYDPDKASDRTRPWKNLGRPAEDYPPASKSKRVDWPEQRWGAMTEFYEQLIERVDGEIGELLNDFLCSGFYNDSWIIFAADHGDMCGEQNIPFKGSFMYEGVVNVPLIIIPPQTRFLGEDRANSFEHNLKPGKRDQLCSLIDIPPTILDIAGLEKPDHWQGQSLLPLVKDASAPAPHETVFAGWSQPEIRMARSKDWKYVWYEDGAEEFFHLAEDPHETRNLANNAACAEIKSELKSQINFSGLKI